MSSASTDGDQFPNSRGSADTEQLVSDDVTQQTSDLYLEDIYAIDSPPAYRTDLAVAESKCQIAGECPDCGRCLAKLFESLPFEVDGNQITRAVFHDYMRKRTGCKDLNNAFLLITPCKYPSQESDIHLVHFYRRDNRKHQGVATVTQEEMREIERHHVPDTYSIVRCTRPLQLSDAIGNTPIKCQIFEAVEEGSRAVRTAWYRGQHVRLSIRTNGSKKVVVPKSRKYSGILCLREPKIAVRMQRRLSSSPKPATSQVQLQSKGTVLKAKSDGHHIDGVCQQRSNLPRSARQKATQDGVTGHTLSVHSSRQKLPDASSSKVNSDSARIRSTIEAKQKQLVPKAEESLQVAAQLVKLLTTVEKAIKEPHKPNAEPPQSSLVELPHSDSETSFFDCSTISEATSGPTVLPRSFSSAAISFLKTKLPWPRARRAFPRLRRLMEQINEQEKPEAEHVVCFFHMAQDLDFKLYIRREIDRPGYPSTNGRRFVVESYVFDDLKEYIGSISLPDTHLHALARLFPGARKNFRLVDDAFELTNAPEGLTEWLKQVADIFNARKWYNYLAELILDYTGDEGAVYEV